MLRSGAIAARVTWDTLPGKPDSFPPAAHTHPWGDVTGKPSLYPPSAHTHGWTEIAGKPATYPPAAHSHAWADITDRPTIPAATPLGTATPKALGTANAGSSTNAAREDHVHPLPAGRVELVGNVTVSRTLLLALGAGMARMALPLTGVTTSDRLMFAAISPCASGCEAMNVYATAANEVTVSYNTPALGIGAVISIPIAVYRIT